MIYAGFGLGSGAERSKGAPMPDSFPPDQPPGRHDAWGTTVQLLVRWSEEEQRADWLLDAVPASLSPGERARVQALLLGSLRHLGRIDAAINALVVRPPRPVVRAALRVAGFEMLTPTEDPGQAAKVCHHLVAQVRRLASAKEAAFANAVGRKLARCLQAPLAEPVEGAPLKDWALYYSHPEWFIARAWEHWGQATARRWLEWNQTAASVVVRWRDASAAPGHLDWLTPVADTPGFFIVAKGHGPELRELIAGGRVHVQDAATRHALDLLAPVSGETLLDLCAAPGGKTLAMGDRLQAGKIVAVDLPGRREPRLHENLAQLPAGVEGIAVAADLRHGLGRALAARNLPDVYPGVLVDVPCSNTGVMRHRVDVKWRLDLGSFRQHARQQLDLLMAAADRVAPGGRLVYSTCSVDREENKPIVKAFIRRQRGAFALEDSRLSLPWETGQDGAAAFLLRRLPSP